MNISLQSIKKFLAERLSLKEDSAHETEIIDSISKNIEFKGSNLWSLIFAIFIASIGLNVNSTAVVIGAMLISPLMGPIMGIGLGIGINDIELIKKAAKNLLIAAIISIGVSAFYFYITPLHDAQSELLARTTPTIWDVFIAIFGGLAGIVGGSRKEKSNVIPGVAIATALMPPLCTAGFGLAIGNWYYFLGAIYLFFINSIFICMSTFIVVRYMKLPTKAFEDKERERKVIRYILYVVTITILPSIYLAYRIVDKNLFARNADNFLKNEFNFSRSHIINKAFKYENGKKEIELLLIGEDLTDGAIDSLNKKMEHYKIYDTKLTISQGLNAKQEIDYSQIKASVLKDIFARQEAEKKERESTELANAGKFGQLPLLKDELKALYPKLSSYSLTWTAIVKYDTVAPDTVVTFIGSFEASVSTADRKKLGAWLKNRTKTDSVQLVIQNSRGR